MKLVTMIAVVFILGAGNWARGAMSDDENSFAPNVDPTTVAISVPENYTLWPALGGQNCEKNGESPDR